MNWLPVVGWEGYYEVSDAGVIRSLDRVVVRGTGVMTSKGREKNRFMSTGAARVKSTLCRDGRSTQVAIGRAVLEAFVDQCPDGMECCHGDGDPWNNNVSNLRWDTRSANMQDSLRHGTQYQAAKTQCINGHEFDEANTIIRPNGNRDCRECRRRSGAVRTRRYKARRTPEQVKQDLRKGREAAARYRRTKKLESALITEAVA